MTVRWQDPDGHPRRATALLEDISRSGACLQLDRPVPQGTVLEMDCRKWRLSARVRYCVYREIGYFVGVEFGVDSRWSVKQFRPLHLLDLQKLALQSRKSCN
jgi:hypothetical protein